MSGPCLVEVSDASIGFDGIPVLEGVSLCVQRGEVISVIGGSGSGKTTLLRLMLGLQKPDRGTVALFGRVLDGWRATNDLRSRCGVVFQAGALFSALTVFDNVALPLRELRKVPESMTERIVQRKLALVGIDPASADKKPSQLSGGMIKRVALARALVLDPELLFLDEPTAGLDPQLAQEFVLQVDSLRRELSLSVVMVTHDVHTVVAVADRVAVVADRGLVAVAPLADIVTHRHPFVRSFFEGQERLGEPSVLGGLRSEFRKARWRTAKE